MPVCFCVYNVRGYNKKYNTILYREPILVNKNYISKYIIFFPGDYSNFFTNSIYTSYRIESKFECTNYCYSYEALFWVISHKYLYDHIIFIKPSNFYNYYAIFSNFLNSYEISSDKIIENTTKENSQNQDDTTQSSDTDAPAKSIKHLLCLLISLNCILSENNKKYIYNSNNSNMDNNNTTRTFSNSITNCNNNIYINIGKENIESKNFNEEYNSEHNNTYFKEKIKNKLVLIGFSKGCTVLISLLREANEVSFFWSIVDSIFFLDPGLNKNIFNFNIKENSLEKLSEHNLKIFIHSTPRQIFDENGVCIHKVLLDFVKMLKKFNISASSYIHYENFQKSINSLSLHFEILVDFHNFSSLLNPYDEIDIKYCKNKKCKKNFLFENWRNNSLFTENQFS